MTEHWPDELWYEKSYKTPLPSALQALDFSVPCAGDNGKCANPALHYTVWHDVERCVGLRLQMREALFCDKHLKMIESWSERVLSRRYLPWWVRFLRGNPQRCRCGRTLQLFTDVLTIVRQV